MANEEELRFHVRRCGTEKVHDFSTKDEAIQFLSKCDQSYQCGCYWWEDKYYWKAKNA